MTRLSARVYGSRHVLFAIVIALLVATAVGLVNTRDMDSQVDSMFADLQKPGSPGCALGVYRNGGVLYSKGYGLASLELGAPITSETIFDIGSTSKQFTAASILLLEQQGKLSVRDDVRKYIPELPDYSQHGEAPITILNLLNHTSGLRDYLVLLGLSGVNQDSVTTDDDALALIVRQKGLNFAAGSKFSYSNTGFFLLSVIVKRASGMTLREFAAQRIFGPLGMTHTVFRDDHSMLIRHRALAYEPGDKNAYKLDVSYYEQLGDGAVHTSIEDLAHWDENFYSGRVGGKNFLETLQEQGKLNNGKTLEYAKGLFISNYRGLRVVRHGGAWGGYRAELLRFPDQHFSVACLCNLANANPEKRAERVAELYLHDVLKPEEAIGHEPHRTVVLMPAQMAALTGTYRNVSEENVVRVTMINGTLQAEMFGATFPLRALSATEFVPVNFSVPARVTFVVGSTNPMLKISGDETITADYLKVREFNPSADELAGLAGDYSSDELGVVYRLRVADGRLKLAEIAEATGIPRTGVPASTLRPVVADEFEIPDQGMNIYFHKDMQPIKGFELRAGGSRGIEFSRTHLAAPISF